MQSKNEKVEVDNEIITIFVKEGLVVEKKTLSKIDETTKGPLKVQFLIHRNTFLIHVKRASGLGTKLPLLNLQD